MGDRSFNSGHNIVWRLFNKESTFTILSKLLFGLIIVKLASYTLMQIFNLKFSIFGLKKTHQKEPT